jgi:hypothetical protein
VAASPSEGSGRAEEENMKGIERREWTPLSPLLGFLKGGYFLSASKPSLHCLLQAALFPLTLLLLSLLLLAAVEADAKERGGGRRCAIKGQPFSRSHAQLLAARLGAIDVF